MSAAEMPKIQESMVKEFAMQQQWRQKEIEQYQQYRRKRDGHEAELGKQLAGPGLFWCGLAPDFHQQKARSRVRQETERRLIAVRNQAGLAPQLDENGMPKSSSLPDLGRSPRLPPRLAGGVSSNIRFLEEKLGLASTPFLNCGKVKPVDPNMTHKKLLYWGVSYNDEGRCAYLNARAERPPPYRHEAPQTSSQEVGWGHGTEWVNHHKRHQTEVLHKWSQGHRPSLIRR